MISFNLPKEPVDKYRIDWWEQIDDRITPAWAIYYVNSKYKDIYPNTTGGSPIVDDWMMYDDGNCWARSCGWETMRSFDKGKYGSKVFLTEKEAYESLVKELQGKKLRLEEEINNLDNDITTVRNWFLSKQVEKILNG